MKRRTLLKLMALGAVTVVGSVGVARAMSGNRYYRGPVSGHFDGQRFFNPGGESPRGLADVLRWKFQETSARWPERWPGPQIEPEPVRPRVDGRDLRVTMIGHATLLIQVAGLNILTDPVFSDRASPIGFAGPKRINKPGLPLEELPPIDIMLVTHNHYDHMDLDTLARLAHRDNPLVITPLGNDTIMRSRLPGLRVVAQDWGDSLEHGPARIHCVPTHHWSARGLDDRRMALWASFVVETPAGRIYHVGDTGFNAGRHYRQARERFGAFRLAVLPIGAYEPRWFMRGQHQDPSEAVEGFQLLNADFAIGHHWATFQLTDEPLEAPREDLFAALDTAGIARRRFRPMVAGESFDVPNNR